MNRQTIYAHGCLSTMLALLLAASSGWAAPSPLAKTLDQAQPRLVKIHGAGGFQGLEAYQSGFLVSAEGHILTVFSSVLDTEFITVTLGDGRRHDARLVGADPRLELAVLKIDAHALPHFDLKEGVELTSGVRVVALSNLFDVAVGDEPVSAQDGVVSVVTSLSARRGVFETPYHGPAYVLDVMTNNPGAAGGALITRDGRLAGMLGKQLRNTRDNTWLNYALPIGELHRPVEEILAGRFVADPDPQRERPVDAMTLDELGITLIPDILSRTPPYVDAVRPDSAAARAGLLPDDLIVVVGDRLVQSRKAFCEELEHLRRGDRLRVSVMRGQELHELTLGEAATP